MDFYFKLLSVLENELVLIEKETETVYKKIGLSLKVCKRCIDKLREKVLAEGFKSTDDECIFFKNIKPKVVGYIFFYLNILNIERHLPFGFKKRRVKFYTEQMDGLKKYFSEYREFYEYHQLGLTYRDREFFTRGKNSPVFFCHSINGVLDANFSTSHDMVLAKILGNTRTITYLQKKLNSTEAITESKEERPVLKWTGAKVDLVELIYALHASTMINNGNVEIKQVATAMEQLFGIDVGDYYRIFLEIRMRKSNQSKLLDILKTSLHNRIIEVDG